MIVLHQVHGQLAGVLDRFLRETVFNEGFLHQNIAAVFLVAENVSDLSDVPCTSLGWAGVLFFLQMLFDHPQACSSEILLIDNSNRLTFHRIDLRLA